LCGQGNIWRTTRRERSPLLTLLITLPSPSRKFSAHELMHYGAVDNTSLTLAQQLIDDTLLVHN